MKIPTTPPSGNPYYHGPPMNGMEMNPQWQGNGVMYDGGAPGNGAAYIVPTSHMPPAGYVPLAGYYAPGASPPGPPAPTSQDFSEYMWMENEEEFDKQVMQQLEEEALMEQCIEAMLADEAQSRMEVNMEEQVSKSTLNPLAAEFVPTFSSPLVIPSTSDQDPQAGLSTIASNVNKSIESSMSELSISQASDALTDSSKSSNAEIVEEACTLEKQERSKEEKIVPVVSANAEISTAAKNEETNDECAAVKKEESKKSDSVLTKSQDEGASKKASSKGGMAKGNKSKETEPKSSASSETTSVDTTSSSTTTTSSSTASSVIESDKPAAAATPVVSANVPAAPAVFNYAAAARANLKSSAPTVSAAAPAPAPKQDSVPKETPATSAKSAPKQTSGKPSAAKDAKEPKSGGGGGSNFARGGPKKASNSKK